MLELRVRPSARRDLNGIWEYTRQRWSAAQADRYTGQIHDAMNRLRREPHLGRRVHDAPADFFKWPCGKHVIFFLRELDVLDIVRILHGGMDVTAHLPDDP